MEKIIKHIGTKRHSGRYPWGSGNNPQRSKDFSSYINELKKQGLSDSEIAAQLGMKITKMRSRITREKAEKRLYDSDLAFKLKEKGYSNVAIGERMGINESSVRSLLDPHLRAKTELLFSIADKIKEHVDQYGYIDIGMGVEVGLGVSRTKLNAAVSLLEDEGYIITNPKFRQIQGGKYTQMKVISKPGTDLNTVIKNRDNIRLINEYSEDGGRTFLGIESPSHVSSSRIMVRYREDGGADKDGTIELRRNVPDLSLEGKNYAQVRVGVDGTHFMKGMAIYGDNMPPGIDIIYNSKKPRGASKDEVYKPLKDDPDNPFGSTIRRQRHYIKEGKEFLSPLNIVDEEGAWGEWQKSLSSQILSKQLPALAKKQLGLAYNLKKEEFDEIMSLTNPAVKSVILKEFADSCDSDAVNLRGAAMPGQASHIILPLTSIKENRVYAPNYKPGTNVVLIRHPHGGKFEIPELIVDDNVPEGKRLLGNSKDAIGIHPNVAKRLSGADFDGDTVLVIPNNEGHIKTKPALDGLKDFDTQMAYPPHPSCPPLSKKQAQPQMGIVSNLITDMTIKGANFDEIARAVRHSMVIIDAPKHGLNYKKSYIDNGIEELKIKYQGKPQGGAATIISRAKSPLYLPHRKEGIELPSGKKIYIDPVTGKKLYTQTGETYTKPLPNKKGPYYIDDNGKKVYTEKIYVKKQRMTTLEKLAEEENPFNLSSGTRIENIYAEHSSNLKALGNRARLELLNTPHQRYNNSARETYKEEVNSLNKKLKEAYRNKPLERRANLVAAKVISMKYRSDPSMQDKDKAKKIKTQVITEQRNRLKAKRQVIEITDKEWEAIQAGAVSHNVLVDILKNTDTALLKQRSMPHYPKGMSSARIMRAKSLLALGHSQQEVADVLGVSVNTLTNAVGGS
jgi:DNA-binding CsgD family transcriptional regulator